MDLGVRTDEPLRPKRGKPAPKFPPWVWHFAFPGAALLAIVFGWALLNGPILEWSARESPPTIGDGDTCRLDGGIASVFVAADYPSDKALSESLRVKDNIGLLGLIAAERVFLVERGASVLVLDRHVLTAEVRVLSGKNAGKRGVVPNEWLKR